MAPRHRISDLPEWKQEKLIGDLLAGRSYESIGKEVFIAGNSVKRWWLQAVSEEQKRAVAAKQRIADIEQNTAVINQDRMDVSRTYESLAVRVEKLITKAEQNEDDAFALAAMEGLRKVLRDIASMQGKLAQNLTVEVKLSESAEWVTLRTILEEVCDEVPAAREPLLRRMRQRVLSVTKEDAFGI